MHSKLNMDREYVIGQIIREFLEREEEIIRRDLKVPLTTSLRKAISIIGPRRAGKTFFLLYIYQQVRETNPAGFLPLDDDRLYPPSLAALDLAVQVLRGMYSGREIRYLFLDEVQEVNGWERFVKRIVDRRDCLVFVTGSSSRLLSKEIASMLRGRTLVYEIFPFNFNEVLRAKGVLAGRYISGRTEALIRRELDMYLKYGGYPEVVLKSEKDRILREYADVMLYRDMVERHNLKNLKLAKLFFKTVFTSFAREFSIKRVVNYLKSMGLRVSRNTLYNYLEYMNDAYIAFPLKRYSNSLRIVEQSIPKLYVVDNGLTRVYSIHTTELYGRLLENLVFMELRKKGVKENQDIFYYRENGREVDFIVLEEDRVKQLIQVTYHLEYDNREQWRREVETLFKASKTLACKNLQIITWSQEDKIRKNNKTIEIIPVWKWILNLYRRQRE